MQAIAWEVSESVDKNFDDALGMLLSEDPAEPQGQEIDMAIYGHGRIANELRELLRGREDGSPLLAPDLFHFDQMHYYGTQSLDHAIETLQIQREATILDVGSGYGGPSRYLAWKHGCVVRAIDLQDGVSTAARALTELVGLQRECVHITTDCTTLSGFSNEERARRLQLEGGQVDHAISLLCILHLGQEQRLSAMQGIFECLRPGGSIYFEDFYVQDDTRRKRQARYDISRAASALQGSFNPMDFVGARFSQEAQSGHGKYSKSKGTSPLSEDEKKVLSELIACPFVPTRRQYIDVLTQAGFVDIRLRDVTESFAQFTAKRATAFVVDEARHVRVHGRELYETLKTFYDAMATLYQGGLGGVVITARRPDDAT